MSFGEHLEELRKVLLRSLVGLAIGTAVGLYFANGVIAILSKPLGDAIKKFNQELAKRDIVAETGWLPPEFDFWFSAGQIPQKNLVDPAELAEALRQLNPDFLQGVELHSSDFQASDFRKESIRSICNQLLGHEPNANPKATEVLTKLLGKHEKEVLTAIAGSAELSESQVKDFVSVMNGLLEKREILDQPGFETLFSDNSGLVGSLVDGPQFPGLKEMKTSLEHDFDPALSRRVNHILISRLFAQETFPLKARLVPITTWRPVNTRAQSLAMTEPFMIWLKAGLISGVIATCPWIFYQLWTFVASGLYPHEQKYVYTFLPISLALFFSGILLAYFFVFDPVLQFLFAFNADAGIDPQPRINDWLSFVLMLPLGFGIAFQLPLVMVFLNRIGIFEVKHYLSKWRMSVMIIFIISMFLTPADPISMLLMAIPLTFLYFLGVAMCKWMPVNRNPFAEDPVAVTR